MMFKLIFLIVFCQYVASFETPEFVILAPKVLTVENEESVCVLIYNGAYPAQLNLNIRTTDEKTVLTSIQKEIINDDMVCFPVIVPYTPNVEGSIDVAITFDKKKYGTVKGSKKIGFNTNPVMTFIETDKAFYKPAQSVKFRILNIDKSFQPITTPITKVWLEDPTGTRLAQWLNVTMDMGIAQLEYTLSAEPKMGDWKIYVAPQTEDNVEIKIFAVKKYVLPRFELVIEHEPTILQDAKTYEWNFCGKYSYGQPVKGILNITLNYYDTQWTYKTQNYTIPLNNDNGCYRLSLSNEELKVRSGSMTVTASLQEYDTDETQSAKIEQTILQSPYEFRIEKKSFYKPYVPNSIKLTLSNSTNKIPISNKLLQICIKRRSSIHSFDQPNPEEVSICQNLTTNSNGIIQFLMTLPKIDSRYSMTADILEGKKDQSEHHLDGFNYQMAYSPSKSFLEAIINDDKAIECNSKLQVRAVLNWPNKKIPSSIKFLYVIQSNGNLLKHGTITKRKQSLSLLEPKKANTMFGLPIFLLPDTNITEDSNHLYTFDLAIDIIPLMSPTANLLLFYTNKDREVVSTTIPINIKQCFKNKVKAAWKENELYPGELATLQIRTTPKSLCTISAVDKSTNILAGKSSKLTKEQIFDSLKRYEISRFAPPRQETGYLRCSICKEEKIEKPEYCIPLKDEDVPNKEKLEFQKSWPREYNPAYDEVDTIEEFESAGILVLSNLTLESKRCYERRMYYFAFDNRIVGAMPALAAPGFAPVGTVLEEALPIQPTDRTPEKRTYFPETWLWDLVPTDENGQIQFEQNLPHTITDWTTTVWCMSKRLGLGIGEPTEIRGFQPFFLDYILPYSVKRGEIVHMKVILFNYLEHSLPVHITLEESDGINLVGDVQSITACVKSRANIVHTFFVKASKLGEVNVTVTAETNSDSSRQCGPEKIINRRDVIVKPLNVEPEGFPVQKFQSTYVCPKDSVDNGTVRRVWEFELPEEIVEDSARAKIFVSGDILGPALQNLDSLVQLPMGCGEQNMLLFVPNLHVLNYLEALNIPNAKLRQQALKNMKIGYEREQNYRHKDASYSAFGESDKEGSLWLTSFVIRSFAQSRSHIFVDTDMLNSSIQWVVSKQLENGCFPTIGVVLHKELLGGLQRSDSNVGLTAYVLISLLESGLPIKQSVLDQARHCLAFANSSKDDIYSKALTVYALTLLNLRDEAKTLLKQIITNTKHEEDLVYWDNGDSTSLELSIEITSYIILSLMKLGGAEYDDLIYNAVRWLSTHRNEKGGFVSTQDTILALEALSKYARTLSVNTTDLSVRITASGVRQELPITDVDKMLLKDVYLPVLPTTAEIIVSGEGCALLQGTLRYNVPSVEENSTFGLDVHVDTTQSSCKTQDVHVCTWYKIDSDASNMAVLEIKMVTGFEAVEQTLENLQYKNILHFKRYENDKNQVNIYFSEVTNERTCIDFQIMETVTVENRTAANIIIYDYYNNKLQAKTDYKIENTCHLPNVPHKEPGVMEHLVVRD